MKKSFLFLASLLAYTAASAIQLGPPRLPAVPDSRFNSFSIESSDVVARPAKAPMKASDGLSMNYTKADEPYTAIGSKAATPGYKYAMALEMTADDVAKFAGNTITAINFYTGTNANERVNNISEATVFLTYDLEEEPFYTEVVSLPNTPFTAVSASLSTPYKFEEGKKIFIGVRETVKKGDDLPIVVDYINHGKDYSGGWIGNFDNLKGKFVWNNIATSCGFVCIGATITGPNLPTDQIEALEMVTDFSAYDNTDFMAQVLIKNNGCAPVSELTLTCKVGDLEAKSESLKFNNAFEYGKTAVITLTELSYPTASPDPIPVTVSITKVGSADNQCPDNTVSASIQIVPQGKGYTPNVVIEEFTGNWCGYCPIGIVTMEKIRENFPNGELIPVAIHVNSGGAIEPMYARTYADVETRFSTGYVPGAVMNRKVPVSPWPYEEVIENFEAFKAMPTFARIGVTAKKSETNERGIDITATTSFSYDYTDASSRYAIAFGVTEDGVGPYNQNNYYAGTNEDAGGWERKAESVSTIYNDVARQLNSFRGLVNSIPNVIENGKEYTFKYSLTLSNNITDTSKINIIAYLIDKKTSEIVNAATVKSADISAGIEQVVVDADANAPVEYFNLLGLPVKNPTQGNIYIRRQGSKATKVIL